MEAQTMKLPAHSFCVLVWSCAVIESAVLATLMHYEHSATPLCNFTSSAMLWFLNASAYIPLIADCGVARREEISQTDLLQWCILLHYHSLPFT